MFVGKRKGVVPGWDGSVGIGETRAVFCTQHQKSLRTTGVVAHSKLHCGILREPATESHLNAVSVSLWLPIETWD